MPKVSVIIPAYNAMTYLPETVDSVLAQTFTDFEILIVNDGSSDRIEQWVSQLSDPRIELISQVNQGISVAYNTGLAHVQGEYLAFLEADDLWQPSKLAQQVLCLDQKPDVGLVYTWTACIDQQGNPLGQIIASHFQGKIWQPIIEFQEVICNPSSVMVRRSCLDQVGIFDPNLDIALDFDIWVRIAANYPIAVVKEPLTFYRRHASSISSTKNRQKTLQSLRQAIEKNFQSVPIELLYLRNRAYGRINLRFAWLAIDDRDYTKASHFCEQALLHYPRLRYSEKYLRLNLAIVLLRWFGSNGYEGLRKLTRYVRRLTSGVTT
jgi:glycosyltransferase involved in cell wall biosynthesis